MSHKEDRVVAEFSRRASGPCLIEVHAGNGCEEVDSIGRTAELYDPSWRGEIAQVQSEIAEAKITKDAQDALTVLARRAHEEVDVTRQARVSMERHSVPANDEVLNLPRVQ